MIVSVSASVWSRVCWPTTLRSVVWAIWVLILPVAVKTPEATALCLPREAGLSGLVSGPLGPGRLPGPIPIIAFGDGKE